MTFWKRAIAIHIMPYNSRNNGNQTIELGQTVEHNIKKIFVQKSHPKYGGETISEPFFKKSKLSISLEQFTVCFNCMPSGGLLIYIETKLQTTCFYLI